MSTRNAALIDYAVADVKPTKPPKWTAEEDAFLRANLATMTDEEIAEHLGRSPIGVHLRWGRDLQLPSRSKAPGIVTAHQAAQMLGIDSHKTAHWVDKGLIPGRLMPGKRKMRLINRADFMRWALDPQNWIYFDIRRVKDPELKKLLKAAAKRWKDEWWKTPRVAKYHGVNCNDVTRYIEHGRIQGRQLEVSLGGRHPELAWKLWFVLKSEATRPDLKFVVRRYKNTKRKRHQAVLGGK